MLRLMNILAVLALLGSAVYAYTIKYATLYQVERMATLKRELTHETDSLAMMKAEWAHIAAPVRIEALADQYLGGQVMELTQIATPASLPEKGAAVDKLGATLDELGLGDGKPDPALAARLAQAPAGEAGAAKPAAASAAKPTASAVKPSTGAAKPTVASTPKSPRAEKTAATPVRPVDRNAQKKPGGVDHDPTASIRTGR